MSLALTDLIDQKVLEELVEKLWRCSGLPTKIVDPQGLVLVSSGNQDICFHFHRRHPLVLQHCIDSDTDLKELLRTQKAGAPLEVCCRSGLRHIGLPIIIAGQHLATLFLSQFFYDPPDVETFRQRAHTFGFDEAEYLAALQQVPVLDRTRVQEIMPFYEVLVQLLTDMGTREEKFRTLFQGVNDALFIIAPSGHILEVNDTACARLGYAAAEFRGMRVQDIDTTEFARVAEGQVQCILKEGVAVFETVHVGKDGGQMPVEISARQIDFERQPAILASARDLTERKKQEQELRYRERFEALLAGISTRFMEEGPAGLNGAIETALQQLLDFAEVDRVYLFCLSGDGTRMSNTHEVCSVGIPCERQHLQDLPVSSLPWLMNRLLSRRIVHIPRIEDLPPEAIREKSHLSEQKIRSLLVVPVLIKGQATGLIGFDAVRAEKAWEERDIVLLRTFANLLGSALERQRTSEALEYRAQLEHLVATFSTRMVHLEAGAIDAAIEEALAEIGSFVAVDRCYVFQFSADGQRLSNTHEWCAADIPSARERLQDTPISAFPWFLEQLTHHQLVYIPAVADLGSEAKAEKAEFEGQKIRSMLCIPMLIEERMLGFIGFDSVRQHKEWPSEIMLLLRLVGESFANALDRRRRDRELLESQERLAAILRSLRAGLVGVDQEGRVTLLNRPAGTMFALEASSARGRLISELPLEPVLQKQIAAVLAGQKTEPVEWTVSPGDGAPVRTIQARTDPIRSAERQRRGAIAMLRDVSAEREMDRMKSEFIATAAHELRTPLSSVLGYAELLLNQDTFGTFSAAEQREFLTEIVNKSGMLSALISDLLDLSRIESGQIVHLTLATARPDQLLEEVAADFRRRIPDRVFELSLPAFLPDISVDAAKIRQVLENLLGNAVKFSPAGSCIRVQAQQQADRIEVVVVDEGVGMSPQALTHIFDRFYRGAADPSIAGLGLGMSIVKNIVEAHGGDISVESTPGRGTRVTFTLPCTPGAGQN